MSDGAKGGNEGMTPGERFGFFLAAVSPLIGIVIVGIIAALTER